MALATRDQLVAALAAATDTPFYKASITSVAGFFYSLFRSAAGMPAASTTAVPTTAGRTLDRTGPGAIPIPSAGSNVLYSAAVDLVGTVAGTVILADRLVEFGGLVGNSTSAQAVSAQSLPARAGTGVGCELWLDIYTALGSTASATVTASYTNSAGTAGRTATLIGGIPASIPANRCVRFGLQAGDVGVQSVQSVTLGTSTATAGNFGLTIRKPIAMYPLPAANIGQKWGYAETALSVIPTDACLELLVLATTTSTGAIQGILAIAQG